MSLQSRIAELISAVGTDIKALDARLDALEANSDTVIALLTVDGLPVLADSSTTFESDATARARFHLPSWSGKRRYIARDYVDHPAPASPNLGDIFVDRPST